MCLTLMGNEDDVGVGVGVSVGVMDEAIYEAYVEDAISDVEEEGGKGHQKVVEPAPGKTSCLGDTTIGAA